jgi:hypothetical protein
MEFTFVSGQVGGGITAEDDGEEGGQVEEEEHVQEDDHADHSVDVPGGDESLGTCQLIVDVTAQWALGSYYSGRWPPTGHRMWKAWGLSVNSVTITINEEDI